MDLNPIETEAGRLVALQQIERIWGAAPGTPDGACLETLIRFVDEYEEVVFPMDVPGPIDVIKFRHEQMIGRASKGVSFAPPRRFPDGAFIPRVLQAKEQCWTG
jgi:HTH-type transcriptional regulator/antitoxin HigA